jgi:tripartite tricarboxylate transporter TctB family protein
MILRRDHIAGVAFVAAGVLVYAFSGDLPWGSLAMPGAGMMPKLVLGLMIIFGLVLMARGSTSPPLSEIDWSDRTHALCVILAAALATALYTTLGFVLTMSLLLFGLTAAVERRPLLHALVFSVGTALVAFLLFSLLLKSPLPRGPFGVF